MPDPPPKAHYGYYALGVLASLLAVLAVLGALLWFYVFWPAGLAVLAFAAYVAASYGYSLHTLRQDRPTDLGGILEGALAADARALDLGCGLGKMTVAVALLVPSGRVIGLDLWSSAEIPGNSKERAMRNAVAEGVGGRVEFVDGNVLKLPFAGGEFDLVSASSVLNNLTKDDDKLRALSEAFRVLRPGGRFLLLEPLRDLHGFLLMTPFAFANLRSRARWEELLEKAGFRPVKFDFRDGTGRILARRN
jgi:SAM-dependent methyltransferase